MINTRTRRHLAGAVGILLAASLVAACSSDNTDSVATTGGSDTTSANEPAPETTEVDPLGEPNPATDTPIKVGFISDGVIEGIDHTGMVEAAKATVAYANEYLGGINGHPIELDICETLGTPTGGTSCGVQFVNDGVAAVLLGTSSVDKSVFAPVAEAGIPFLAAATAAGDIMGKPGGFVLQNPIGLIGAPAIILRDAGLKKAATILIDVPAATGPITMIATPAYAKMGVELQMVNVAPSVADMTPQVQEAISAGAEEFGIIGTSSFVVSGMKALRQLGFDGKIILGAGLFTEDEIASIPGGFEGVTALTAFTNDTTDPDFILYNAILNKYSTGQMEGTANSSAFVAVLGLVRALTGVTDAVDAPSILAALQSMPEPVALPLGMGGTFQCGQALVVLTPNVCTTAVLVGTMDKNGNGSGYKLLDTTELF